jgi:DNA/RNA endonuclease G (NUC1)
MARLAHLRSHASARATAWARALACALLCLAAGAAVVRAAEDDGQRPCGPLEPRHNRLHAETENEKLLCFDAYVSAFAAKKPADGPAWGIPLWVGYEIDRAPPVVESGDRPKWITVKSLADEGLAPSDASYSFTRDFRRANRNFYERGHLAPKYIAERLGRDAARFTHNLVNAVPQRGGFNRGPWFELECKTGAWANEYGAVWVIAGPVFLEGHPSAWLGNPGTVPVAIPDALFKIVARTKADSYDVLAFIYPQDHPLYVERKWDHTRWLTSLKRIEDLTGLRLHGPDIKISGEGATPEAVSSAELWPQRRQDFDPGCARFATD